MPTVLPESRLGPLDALQEHVQPFRDLVAVLVGGQLRGPPGDAPHPVVLEQPLQRIVGRRDRLRSASFWSSSCSVCWRALASASGSSAVRKPACTRKNRWRASQCSMVGRRSPLMRAPACCRDMPAPSAISCCVYLRPFAFSRVRRSRSSRWRKRACTSGSPAGCPLSSAFTTGSGTPDATDSRPTSKTSPCATPSRSASAVTRATTAGSAFVGAVPGPSKPPVTERSPTSLTGFSQAIAVNLTETSRCIELASRSRHNCGQFRPSIVAECHDS